MAVANLSWSVSEADLAALVAAEFDAWKLERQVAPDPWVEVSFATTRPPLVENGLSYVYQDAGAPVGTNLEPNASYRAVPYRTSDAAEDTPVVVTAVRRGYVTPADILAEGYLNPPWIPAKVWKGIDRATTVIDSVCRQWFEPRYAQLALDGTDHDQLWLNIPVCALHTLIQDDSTSVDLSDLIVANRHLTRGQLEPDDRANPQIAYALDYPPGYRGRRRRIYADSALFGAGRQNVILKGVFGYTELGAGYYAAETASGSQIPVSFGGVPADIARAALLLTVTYMSSLADQQEMALQSRITQIRTRDQYVSFSDASASDGSYGLTGNLEVDNILMRHMGPLRMGGAG